MKYTVTIRHSWDTGNHTGEYKCNFDDIDCERENLSRNEYACLSAIKQHIDLLTIGEGDVIEFVSVERDDIE